MKKARRAILFVMSLVIMLTSIATAKINTYAAEDEEYPYVNAMVLEDILENRQYVLNTFATYEGSFINSGNPYADIFGVSSQKYMHTEIMDRYENNGVYKALIDVYYRANHFKDSLISIPVELLDLFSEENYSSLVDRAEQKTMDSLLSQILSMEYTSSYGTKFNEEVESLEELRSLQESAKEVKSYLSEFTDPADKVADITDKLQVQYLEEILPEYTYNVDKAFDELDGVYDDGLNCKDFIVLKSYAGNDTLFGYDSMSEGAAWKLATDLSVAGKRVSGYLNSIGKPFATTSAMLKEVIALESMLSQSESLTATLRRIGTQAAIYDVHSVNGIEKNLGFQQITEKYADMLELTEENALLAVCLDEGIEKIHSEINSYVWNAVEKKVKKWAVQKTAEKAVSESIAKATVTKAAARLNLEYQFVTATANQIVDLGTSSEKIFELCRLRDIKAFAIAAYSEDLAAYERLRTSDASLEQQDAAAALVLDDLDFLKRITLLQNELGYTIQAGMAKSTVSQYQEMMAGYAYDNRELIDELHTSIKDALIETNIYELYNEPLVVKDGDILVITDEKHPKVSQEKYGYFISATDGENGQKRLILNIEKRMAMGGIILEKDSALQVDTDIFIYTIESQGAAITIADDAVLETMEYSASDTVTNETNEINGDLNVEGDFSAYSPMNMTGNIHIGGDIFISTVSHMNESPNGETSNIKVDGDVEIRYNDSPRRYALLKVENANLEIGGDFLVNENAVISNMLSAEVGLQMNHENSRILVHGDTYFYGNNTYNDADLTSGTLEMKGNLYGSGLYDTCWDASEDFHMIFSGEEVQTIDIAGDGFISLAMSHYPFGRLSVPGAGIRINKPLRVRKLETDIVIHNDMNNIQIDDFNNKKVTVLGELDLERSYLTINSGELFVDGDVLLSNLNGDNNKCRITIEEGSLRTTGSLYVDMTRNEDGTGTKIGNSGYNKFEMTGTKGKIFVGGDSWINNVVFKGESVELQGDIIGSWTTYLGMDFIFSGDQIQQITPESVSLSEDVMEGGLGNLKVAGVGIQANDAFGVEKLNMDITIDGDVSNLIVMDGGAYNVTLNGSILNSKTVMAYLSGNVVINGDIGEANSTFYGVTVGEGSNVLLKGGNYFKNLIMNGGTITFEKNVGSEYRSPLNVLKINSPEAKLIAMEEFSYPGDSEYITQGTMEFYGGSVFFNEQFTGVKVYLGGNKSGEVRIDQDKFLSITKSDKGEEIDLWVEKTEEGYFLTVGENCAAVSEVVFRQEDTPHLPLTIQGNLTVDDFFISYFDVNIEDSLTVNDMYIRGYTGSDKIYVKVYPDAVLTVNGNMKQFNDSDDRIKYLQVDGTAVIHGNMLWEDVQYNANYGLIMQHDNSDLTIKGDLSLGTNNILTKGIIRLGGNYTGPDMVDGTILQQMLTSMSLVEDSVFLDYKETRQLEAVTYPINYDRTNMVWESSNPSVVAVDANGLLTAKGVGEATITVSLEGITDQCRVVVEPLDLSGYTLTGKNEIIFTEVECTANLAIYDDANQLLTEGVDYTITMEQNSDAMNFYIEGINNYIGRKYFWIYQTSLQRLVFDAAPTKRSYLVGDIFEPSGMKILAVFGNGCTRDVTDQVTYSQESLTLDTNIVEFNYVYGEDTYSVRLPIKVSEVYSDVTTVMGVVADGTVGISEDNIITVQVQPETVVDIEDIVVIPSDEYATVSELQPVEEEQNQYTFTIISESGEVEEYTLAVVNAESDESYELLLNQNLKSILEEYVEKDFEEETYWKDSVLYKVKNRVNDNPVMSELDREADNWNTSMNSYTAPVNGNADYPEGTDGTYQAQVELCDGVVAIIEGKLKAKAYSGTPNKQYLEDAKALITGKEYQIETWQMEEYDDPALVVLNTIARDIYSISYGIDVGIEDIQVVSVQEPVKGNAENPLGVDGCITVNVTMTKGETTDTAYGVKVIIKAEAIEVCNITVSIEGQGTSDKLGNYVVAEGEPFEVTFEPVKGWKLVGYKIDGYEMEPSSELTYYIGEVWWDYSIVAVFEPVVPYPATLVLETKEYTNTGEAITPIVKVLDALGNEMSSMYYDVFYENNTGVGIATVKVVLKDIYEGTLTDTFVIKAREFKVHFDSQGGSECEDILVREGEPYGTLPTSEKEGYTFVGWMTGDTGELLTEASVVTLTEEHTLVAQWEANVYTVNFESNGGNAVEPIQVRYHETYGKLPTPLYAGCEFLGWFTENEAGEEITSDSIVNILADQTLYARWSMKYTAEAPKADVDSGSEVEIGSRVKLSTATNGATIYYIVTPQEEDESVSHSAFEILNQGTCYEDAILVEEAICIEAVATKDGYKNSEVATFTYTVVDDSDDWGDVTEEDRERAGWESTAEIPEDYWVAGVEDVSYLGKAITFPGLHLYYHKTLLTEKVDYTVKYTNNTNAGVAKITFTGKGNYSGKCVQEFNIIPLDLNDAVVEQPVIMVKFNNKVQKKTNKLTYDVDGMTVTLKAGKDFTYEYPKTNSKDKENYDANAFKAVGDYTVLLKGKGNYAGETSFVTSIKDATLVSALKYTIKGSDYNGGEPVEPTALTVKNGKAELKGRQVADANEASAALELLKNGNESPEYDYIYYLEDNTEIGNAKIIFVGIEEKGYVGTVTKTYNINGKALKSAKIKMLSSSYPWTGKAIDPFVVEDDKEAAYLLHGTETLLGISKEIYDAMPMATDSTIKRDYDYVYELTNNQNIGTATLILCGVNEYSGTVKKTFKITGKSISGVKVDGVNKNGYDYTGSAVEIAGAVDSNEIPEGFKVYFAKTSKADEIPLNKGEHYTVSYQKNESKGTATLILTGINGYTGTKKVSFKINAYEMSPQENRIQVDFADSDATVSYQKNGSKPEIMVTDTLNGNQLVLNKDYTVKYKNNNAVGNDTKKPTVIITGKGNYGGSKEAYFVIENSSLENVELTAKDVVFKEKANIYKSPVTLVDSNGVKLVAGKDYDKNVTYTYARDTVVSQIIRGRREYMLRDEGEEVQKEDIILVGTQIRATVTGIGNYSNTQQSTVFKFVAADVSKASVKVEKQTYTGKEVKPAKEDITITLNKTTLKKTDYEIVGYSNNIKQGKGKITIRGLGNYGGTKTVDFVIQKKALWLDVLRRIME